MKSNKLLIIILFRKQTNHMNVMYINIIRYIRRRTLNKRLFRLPVAIPVKDCSVMLTVRTCRAVNQAS